MSQKILLLTKNYPPQIGGMEKYSYDLYNRLISQGIEVKIIAAGPRNEWLLTKKGTNSSLMKIVWKFCYIVSELWRLSFFAIRCLTIGLYYGYISNIVWSLDGSIVLITFLLGKITNTKTRVTIHGTDIVWNKKIYQVIIPKIIAKIDEVYVISKNTIQECIRRGISVSKISLVPHTFDTITFTDPGKFDKNTFLKNLGIKNLGNKIILFSIGRWVERKGFHWFLENVMPALDPEKFHYILAGFGAYERLYKTIIFEKKLSNVSLIGKIDSLNKARLYVSSDLFIMPNIPVENDCEGFGIVLLEAAQFGTPMLASKIDGIGEELIPGLTLVPSYDESTWIETITPLMRG